MGSSEVAVFVKWVRQHQGMSDRVRHCMTAVKLLADDDELVRFLHRESPAGWADETLIEEFFSVADPPETVELLSRFARHLSPALFKKVFDRTLQTSSDIEVLSRLMWVAGMYLDRNLGAFPLPRSLADRLLASEDLDHRLGGLKALRHSLASSDEVVRQITAAMKRGWEDKWAGLSPLCRILDEQGARLADAISAETLNELRNVLAHIAETDSEPDARRAAARCIGLL